MLINKPLVWFFIVVCPLILHTIFFPVAFDLAVSYHRQARKSGEKSSYSEVSVIRAKLGDGSIFVRVIHEVYISLENLWFKLQSLFDGISIFLVLLILEHVHECAVIYTVHTKSSYKVAFHHPECFSQQ